MLGSLTRPIRVGGPLPGLILAIISKYYPYSAVGTLSKKKKLFITLSTTMLGSLRLPLEAPVTADFPAQSQGGSPPPGKAGRGKTVQPFGSP
jgi:hypothetical protein